MHAPAPDEPRRFIAALKRREERAFNRLVLAYQDRVFNLCYRLLGSREEAREIAQDVFVTVFQKIEQYRGDAKLSTWILRIASNHSKNRIKYLARRHDRGQESLDELAVPPTDGRLSASLPRPDQVYDAIRLEALIARELAALDPLQREVVVLRDIEGLTYEEIVEVTGANLGTIKSRLHRGRMGIKEALDTWQRGEAEQPRQQPTPREELRKTG